MFDHRHYVPVLKGKQGEFDALRELSAADKSVFTPVVEIVPPDRKALPAHLDGCFRKLTVAWGRTGRIFVDLFNVATGHIDGTTHAVTYAFNRAALGGLPAAPVIRLTAGPNVRAAEAAVFNANRQIGLCLRLSAPDLNRPALAMEVNALLAYFPTQPQEIDLLVDLGEIPANQFAIFLQGVQIAIGRIPHLANWRSFTVAGAGFPESLAGITPGITNVPRLEWQLWYELARGQVRLARIPTYGDYAIAHPELPTVDPRMMSPSASIRYTANMHWVVVKGRGTRTRGAGGFGQFRGLCQSLIQHPDYCGRNFSWGDMFIDECAAQRGGTGSLTTWRKVGTNHHIKLVLHQIASLP